MSFFGLPDKAAITNTYFLTLLFCLPLAGTKELFIFIVIGQFIAAVLVWLFFRKDTIPVTTAIKLQFPLAFRFIIAWLIAITVSYIILFFTSKNGWMTLAATIRQLYIAIQIAFCLSLLRFLAISGKSAKSIFLSFAFGVVTLTLVHFCILYWGPYCGPAAWSVDPFLSPNMRDAGDLATAAIAIFGIMAWTGKKSLHSTTGFIGYIISWTYLLWSGGRIGIVSAMFVNVLILAFLWHRQVIGINKITMTVLAFIIAFMLCEKLSIYDWNGFVRFSSEWQQKTFQGDMTNGRMDAWIWSIKAWLQKPWFGLGPYSFYFIPTRFAQGYYHDHPHNVFIQCLVEWGIVGTALFLIFLSTLFITGIKNLWQSSQINPAFLASAAIISNLSISSLVSGSFWDYQPVMILVTAFAIFPALPKLKSRISHREDIHSGVAS